MTKRFPALVLIVLSLVTFARAQTAEVTVTLNEQFFESLLDALFKNSSPPEFPLSENRTPVDGGSSASGPRSEPFICPDAIRLQREVGGTRTAVRLRDGKVFAPIAFAGNYNPPLIGCLDFSGVAETTITLDFDREKQALIGRATVSSVSLSGTGGVGSSVLARLVQGSIDKKINPIQILQLDRVSFVVPVQNSGSLRMRAVAIGHEIVNGALNVRISYEFLPA